VLLVEDDDLNRELAVVMLGDKDIEVTSAWNGQEALEILQSQEFDVVLMDVQMPVMDGYAATREIRRQERLRDLPVIAMTANAMSEDLERAREAGMNDHLVKPFNMSRLLDMLDRWARTGEESAAGESPGSICADLVGIDCAQGLAIVEQDEALYRRLLRRFRDGQRGFVEAYHNACQDDDPDAPGRAAHTLKGVAATIGALSVRDAAEALELATKGGAPAAQIDAALAEVGKTLGPVIASLDRVLGDGA